jgi:glycosyltransferase involved in cell wall biosynthesis
MLYPCRMPNKKIKTLIILSPGFPANEDDSTCIPPQQIFVKALNAVNPDLNIIVLAFQYPFFSKEYKWHNIKVISFGHAGNGRGSRLFTAHRVWSVLKKLDKDYEIIGLLSFWLGKCALVGDKFAKKHQLKHYCWILGQDAKIGNKYFYKMKPEGDILIALSDFVVKEFNKNYYIRPQHIIPVGIDTTLFNASNNVRNIDVLGAGSLIPLKQYSIFVQLINELKIALPNIKAVICGDGQEIDKLQAMVRGMSLENNISFAGRLPHNEVLSLMQQSKTFVHTSSYEGFGAV